MMIAQCLLADADEIEAIGESIILRDESDPVKARARFVCARASETMRDVAKMLIAGAEDSK